MTTSMINKRTVALSALLLVAIAMLITASGFALSNTSKAFAAEDSVAAVACTAPDCIHHSISSQAVCTQVGTQAAPVAPVGSAAGWWKGLSTQVDQAILKGDVIAYKIQWFNGSWSDWFVTGVNDIDVKFNPAPANEMRRQWSYFTDHKHTYIICK